MSYKWCAVPKCTNTSKKTPEKLFASVSKNVEVRRKWLQLSRRDPNEISINTNIFFCEDHFDLPNDMENFMQYHVMGSVAHIRMKPGCVPTKFECQLDSKTPTTNKKKKTMAARYSEKYLEDEDSTLEAAARDTQPAFEDSLFDIKQEVLAENETIIEINRLTDIDISNTGNITVKVERLNEDDESIDTERSLACDDNQLVVVREEIITKVYNSIEDIPIDDIEQIVVKTETNEDSGLIDIHESTIEEDIQRHCSAFKEITEDDKLLSHENDNPSTGIKLYTCNECDWKFTRKRELKSHLSIHSEENPYSCDKCDMKFGYKLNLNNHKMTVHCKPKLHQCHRCDMTFTTKWNLNDHLRTHTGEKPYACGSCTKSFRTTGTLRKHARVHSREKPYKCDCGKSYTQKSSLVQHKVSHTGDRPYSCLICSKSFNRSSVLLKHKKTHEVENPQHTCNRCDISYKFASTLRKHIIQTHSRN